MKHNAWWVTLSLISILSACRTNPNRAEKLDTALVQSDLVSGGERIGVHQGEMVVQDQVRASERLRDVQNEVYALEDKVYGTRKLGSEGLYGQLRACKRKLASKAYGGDGTLTWSEPLDRLTDKEEEVKLGLSEKNELIGLSREYLRDRLTRFTGYKLVLQKRADDFGARVEACRAELNERTPIPRGSAEVSEREVMPTGIDRAKLNAFMCTFVRKDASLRELMLNSFARGWLALTDFGADQNLIAATLKDKKGEARDNVLLFNGWKLSFDEAKITLGDLLNGGRDAKLLAWTTDKFEGSTKCLGAGDGVWNP